MSAMDKFMKEAISEAKKSLLDGGIPIGSVLVRNGSIIGRGFNKRIQDNDPMAHAEIDCLRNAGRIGSYEGTMLYTTLTPCYLCAGAVVQFGIQKVIVGESRNFAGAKTFMESHGVEDGIQITAATYERLKDKYLFEERGIIEVKGKGEMKTYLLTGRKTS